MALDGITAHAIACELDESLSGGRIDKIHQPERSEIVMTVRNNGENYRLLLCANPSFPRAHLTEVSKENPINPPMFCMLLRKHLTSGKVVKVYQHEFERIIIFDIEVRDELGVLGIKKLIIEIMGKHSNLILANADGRIIDSIFHVDITMSRVRQIMPGLSYELPPSNDKVNPLALTDDEIKAYFNCDINAMPKMMVNTFMGISPLMAEECMLNAVSGADVCVNFINVLKKVKNREFDYAILYDTLDKKPRDFTAIELKQYGNAVSYEKCDFISEALDLFYVRKAKNESMRQKSAFLEKLVSNHLDRCYKKLQIQNETLSKAESKEKYRIKGDLITANIYRIEKGDKEIEAENFYENPPVNVKISLREDLTPSQNAAKYYTKYNKLKTAETECAKQKELNLVEIDYLESVYQALMDAETSADINEIKDELSDEGYIRAQRGGNKKKQSVSKPMEFVSGDGILILVGKNNKQNDYLTLKLARSTDIWLHTKDIHGSHVIIKTNGEDVPDSTITDAARICAYYSKARNGKNVPVDYTFVKYVKKPSGAKPGMVIYTDNKTAYVTPDEEEIMRLKKHP